MRILLTILVGICSFSPVRAEGIAEVLDRSHRLRLALLAPAAEDERAATVRHSFEQLREVFAQGCDVELRTVTGLGTAQTLHGHVIVADTALADLPEGERLYILAHEFGHVLGDHWSELGALYQRWIPGEVRQEDTDPIAEDLGREASFMAHRHEIEADTFALGALRALGRPAHDALTAFMRQSFQMDTATHPSTRKRVAALRSALVALDESR